MVRSKPTAFQRQVATLYAEKQNVDAVAVAMGVSKGKVKKALQACGIQRAPLVAEGAENRPVPQTIERDPHDVESVDFDFTGDSTVKEAWRDETPDEKRPGQTIRNLWLRSNDGDLVCVPERAIRRLPI